MFVIMNVYLKLKICKVFDKIWLIYKCEKMAQTIGPVSMIKKTCHQLYQLTCSFKEVYLNVTHLMWVAFMLRKAV